MKKHTLKGSLTIEAALVVPIFLYCMVGFIYFIQIISLHEDIQQSITKLSFQISTFGYLYDEVNIEEILPFNQSVESNEQNEQNITSEQNETSDQNKANEQNETSENSDIGEQLLEMFDFSPENLFTNYLFQKVIKEHLLDSKINLSIIEDGQDGIHTYFSSFMEEDENIHMIVHYKVKIPFGVLSLYNIPMIQRVTIRGWVKETVVKVEKEEQGNSDKEEIRYVTEHGEVYHKHKECTYINIKVTKVMLDKLRIETQYQDFTSCSRCIKDNTQESAIVYITGTGKKYHISTLCSSLKRLVKEVSIMESTKYRQCSRCYK